MSRKLMSCLTSEYLADYEYSTGGSTTDIYFDLTSTHEISDSKYDFLVVVSIGQSDNKTRVLAYQDISDFTTIKAKQVRIDGTRTLSEDYSSINSISQVYSFNPYFLTSMSNAFKGAKQLKTVNTMCWRFQNNIDMSSAFAYSGVTSLDFSKVDLSKISNVTDIFKGCDSLSYIKLTHSDASKITSIVNQLPTHTSGTYTIDLSGNSTSVLTSLANLSRTGWTIKRSQIKEVI